MAEVQAHRSRLQEEMQAASNEVRLCVCGCACVRVRACVYVGVHACLYMRACV
jgi:hypothetical protein